MLTNTDTPLTQLHIGGATWLDRVYPTRIPAWQSTRGSAPKDKGQEVENQLRQLREFSCSPRMDRVLVSTWITKLARQNDRAAVSGNVQRRQPAQI